MNTKSTLLAVCTVGALCAISVPISQQASAQGSVPAQQPPMAQPRQGGGMRPVQGAPGGQAMMGGGGGGGAAMIQDGGFLFVVQGGQLFKIRKSDLGIEKQTPLMPPMMGRPGMAAPGGAAGAPPVPPPGEGTEPTDK